MYIWQAFADAINAVQDELLLSAVSDTGDGHCLILPADHGKSTKSTKSSSPVSISCTPG